jgi:hypothetical protein
MAIIKRYRRCPLVKGGRKLGTSRAAYVLRRAVELDRIQYQLYTLKEGERLDSIAGRFFGNGDLWWIIAAASGIGWGLQVPPGTRLVIPSNIAQVEALVG